MLSSAVISSGYLIPEAFHSIIPKRAKVVPKGERSGMDGSSQNTIFIHRGLHYREMEI